MNKKKEGLFKGASVAELYSKFGVVLILILCLIIGTILSPEFLTGSNPVSYTHLDVYKRQLATPVRWIR